MKFTRVFAFMALAGMAGSAFATNGYFAHGYGMSAKGMGGAGIAYPQDTLAAATNPAGMVHLGNRMDIGLEIFVPDRGFESPSMAHSFDGNGDGAMESWFPIPEFGYNRMINNNMSVGVSVFGNGGMNTSYTDGDHPFTCADPDGPGPAPTSCNPRAVGIDLMQVFIAPTLAYKVNEQLSVGASLNLVAQFFEARGLENFDGALQMGGSPYAGAVTNNGHDNSYGAGVRVGVMYKVNDAVTLGATYQSKSNMSEFDDYAGLFPNGGEFDIPASYGAGIAFKANDKLDVAFDVTRIEYGKVDVTGNNAPNMSDNLALFVANQHGFGWDNQTVYKLGAAYKYSNDLTLRAGVNYGEQPIDVNSGEMGMAFNTLAPGVVETHLTFGFTKNISADSAITGYYMHAFNKEVDGYFTSQTTPDSLEMNQNAFGLSFNKKL